MSAVLDAPEQLGLEGLPPEPQIAPAGIAVRGRLERRAEVRTSSDGATHLVVQILQHKGALPFVAMWHAKSVDQSSDLRDRAPHLVRDTPVIVTGAGLLLGRCDDDRDALVFYRCESVLVPGGAAFTHLQNPE